MAVYRKRVADAILERKLAGKGAVLIQGPKWCGKTTTAERQAKSVLYMSAPDDLENNLTLAAVRPSVLLKGACPRLLDEWQLAPKLWDAVRFEVDHRQEMGQFILTGSAVPASMDDVKHTGTGRFAWLRMRTMSLHESGESSGTVSLAALFDGAEPEGTSDIDIERLAFLLCRGGWPQAVGLRETLALDQARDYIDAVAESDMSRVDGVSRNPDRVRKLLRSYARHQGAAVNHRKFKADLMENESVSFNEDTVYSYITALKKMFVVEDVSAWNPNLRSGIATRTSDTRYFSDPSLAAAALGCGPKDLIADVRTMGLLLETMCVRDLRVFADALDGEVRHYRDASGLECDAVVHLRDGRYGLVEVKLGGARLIEEGAKSLCTLAAKIDTGKMKPPAFRMVLTGVGQYAYRRPDGVLVVPLGCLKP